ncbi:MAG: hypothetical protein HRU40_07920 [Saprospiraceae bacterium]|nr:hypothetical protein [Saprospiraceae bacterium]
MKYQPISCDYYDELEAIAVMQKTVTLLFSDPEGNIHEQKTQIKTFETRYKEEFMILPSGQEIRLDRIISVDGKHRHDYC